MGACVQKCKLCYTLQFQLRYKQIEFYAVIHIQQILTAQNVLNLPTSYRPTLSLMFTST